MPAHRRSSHSIAWMILISNIVCAAILLAIHLTPALWNPSCMSERWMLVFATALTASLAAYVAVALMRPRWYEWRYRRMHQCRRSRTSASW